MRNSVFYKLPDKKMSNLENKGVRKWVFLFLSSNWETPCLGRRNMTGEVRWCITYLEDCSHRDMTQAVFSIIARKKLPVPVGSSEKKGPITSFFIKVHHTLTFSESWSCSVMRIFTSPHD
jgi:hypothetical protein